jgi:hypothetical protein
LAYWRAGYINHQYLAISLPRKPGVKRLSCLKELPVNSRESVDFYRLVVASPTISLLDNEEGQNGRHNDYTAAAAAAACTTTSTTTDGTT